MTSISTTTNTPIVTRDPRFTAGRNLVKKGLATEGAIDIFATLVEEATAKYGESSIEVSPAYYEYGNALLRAAQHALTPEEEDEEVGIKTEEGDMKMPAVASSSSSSARDAAASAAERRQKQLQEQSQTKHESSTGNDSSESTAAVKQEEVASNSQEGTKEDDSTGNDGKAAAVKEEMEENDKKGNQIDEDGEAVEEEEGDDKEEEEGSDLTLSLEMMENAFSIMEEYNASTTASSSTNYKDWVEEQLPRVLTGLGDVLSTLSRHADAADAYSRALELRTTLVESRYGTSEEQESSKKSASWYTIEHLQARRQLVEATILIAEELLSCDPTKDVITTETSSLIVKASERVEYARGYYDKARDALQETVLLMGQLAAAGRVDVTTEKENVCFIATLVMGVGTTLAELDEEKAEQEAIAKGGGSAGPPKKKPKKS